ncbi:MAG: hypothetical protein HQK50_02630 [Oligoflexia bacterium]|nr:hypothetical protein [Oligoflexia bacterium]MBF0364436.1 hypothetical protein [Oligoflexia bacterium]
MYMENKLMIDSRKTGRILDNNDGETQLTFCFFSKKILPYLDGHLHGKIFEYMKKHVEVCPACKQKHASYKRSLELVDSSIIAKKISSVGLEEITREVSDLLRMLFKEIEKSKIDGDSLFSKAWGKIKSLSKF